ncbi:uncharacterized protein [Argopecten irradians]|uniref:uncharacterized protein isoform X2 n=1 Tax=Argopecten irradians TaxID=31199 RepID=UPI00371FA820
MPQKRCALGLERLCLMRISKSLEKYWYRPFEEQFGNTSRLLHVIGPFDHISSELIQKVIDVLVEYKIFNPKYLQLMFSSHLIQLDLSKASIRQNNVVDTIGIRCYAYTMKILWILRDYLRQCADTEV